MTIPAQLWFAYSQAHTHFATADAQHTVSGGQSANRTCFDNNHDEFIWAFNIANVVWSGRIAPPKNSERVGVGLVL